MIKLTVGRSLSGFHWLQSGFLGGAIALTLFNSKPAEAFSFASRTSSYDITFGDRTFSDANARYTLSYTTEGMPDDLINYTLTTKSGAENFQESVTGSNTIETKTQTETTYAYSIRSSGGSGGILASYDTAAVAPELGFDQSWLVRAANGNAWDLEFAGGGSHEGNLTQTLYQLAIAIPGNWSTLGTQSGQTEVKGLDPAFTVEQYFVYDSVSNTTRFTASQQNWQGNSPNLNFVLHGAEPEPVPEPSAILGVMLVGVGIGLAYRKRERF